MGASFVKVQSIRVSAQPGSRPSAVLQGMELFLERPMTDVQFSSVKEGPSCSRLGTVVGLSASAQMIWLITITIFLGAVVAVMLVFWFFSQREQILAAIRKPEEQRIEARISTRVGLELSGPDEPLIYEITFTENVSRHGARVVTKRRWSPNDSVIVKLPQESRPSRARITYCQPFKEDQFATGLQFSLAVYDWIRSP